MKKPKILAFVMAGGEGGATGMVVSQLVEVQPLPCEKGRSRRKQGCPKKLQVATQQGIEGYLEPMRNLKEALAKAVT